MTSTAIVPGSIQALALQSNRSIAETFVNADVVVICDVSGSMGAGDSRGGKRRFDVANEELAALQKSLPGKIAVLSFSDSVNFCPGGVLIGPSGGTDLAKALQFAKAADVPGMQFIVISDGEPQDEDEALRIARTYKNRIDVIYCGPENRPSGREFLELLARTSGGVTITADKAVGLLQAAQHLLLHA